MTVQFIMLLSLGFFIACILAIALAPVYRRRADRLALERVQRALPVSIDEIRADKDRLRAEHAIVVHRLEARAEEARLTAARQKVETNRRDARIHALEEEVRRFRTELEEHVNARRVLEHNIAERLPHVMSRLDEAHKLLEQRDDYIETLNASAQKGVRALDEALMLNAQQRSEIDRLRSSLTARAAGRFAGESARGDNDAALRSELESLRARARKQSDVIDRLQGVLSKEGKSGAESGSGGHDSAKGADQPALPEIERLRRDLKEARVTLQLASKDVGEVAASASAAGLDAGRELKAKADNLETEVLRLKAALATYEAEPEADGGRAAKAGRTGSIAAKARLNSLQAQISGQDDLIKRLRTELAASNERLAHQAANFRDEMRRIGAGTRPTTGEARQAQKPARRASLVERVKQQRSAEIVALPKSGSGGGSADKVGEEAVSRRLSTQESGVVGASKSTELKPGDRTEEKGAGVALAGERDAELQDQEKAAPKSRMRLMDRIAGLARKEA